MQPLHHVTPPVIAAQDLVLLEQRTLARGHVVVVDRARRGERSVPVAQDVRVQLGVGGQRGQVGRLIEGDFVLFPLPLADAQAGEPSLALREHEVIPEQLEPLQEDVAPVRDDRFPVVRRRLFDGGPHELEVLGPVEVGPDVEVVPEVVEAVFVPALAREEEGELALGIARFEEAMLVGQRVGGGDDDVPLRFRLADAGTELLVVLLVHERVVRGVGADAVPVDLVRTQGAGIPSRIEERPVVLGPHHVAGGALDGLRVVLSRVEIPDADGVDAAPARVLGPRHQVAGSAHRGKGGVVIVSFGVRVDVEDDLLGRVERSALPSVDRIVPAVLGAAVVEEVALPHGHGEVALLDPALDLLEQLRLETPGVRH